MKKLALTLALCASMLTLSQGLSARPGEGGGFEGISRMARHLDLSEDQQTQITTIVNASKLENAVDQERSRQIQEELRAQGQNFDSGTAQSLADEFGVLAARLAYSRAFTMSQVRDVLTAEQLEQMDTMRAGGGKGRRGSRNEDSFLQDEE
jgi:Spy/CpxP family protein refolding chaperone